ncbi:universal stress protein [Chitinophaga sp. 22536]|uniref:universal stress protein n=1 Tax=unclassified Chitinophaga TaxID=2619133 RepID=UPI003F846EE0
MKKMIAAVDALHFSPSQLATFRFFAREQDARLTIICLDNFSAEMVPMTSMYPECYAINYAQITAEGRAALEWQRTTNIRKLEDACAEGAIGLRIVETNGYPVQEIVKESRFADLLLLSADTSFGSLPDTVPTRFVTETLAGAECPVMVMPGELSVIREIVFSYNGTFSSTYAIRTFTTLFPECSNIPVKLLYVEEKGHHHIPHEEKIINYLSLHYDQVTTEVLTGDPATAFLAYLIRRNDCIVTYGAYGRSGVSRFFHRSDAENVLRTVNIPIFITHP